MRSLLLTLALVPCVASAATVPVTVYEDADRSALSDLAQSVGEADVPLPGVTVLLLGGGEAFALTTGDDGRVAFEGVDDGAFLLLPELAPGDAVTSHNLGRRVGGHVADGKAEALVYVAIGDSTAVVGSSEPYPERLTDLLSQVHPVDLHNLAVPGTTTKDWLPGAGFQWGKDTVQSRLGEADLITLSIGGNDVQDAATSMDPEEALLLIDEAFSNIATIAVAIRELNPEADLVVTVYPNHALSESWEDYVPDNLIGLVRTVVDSKLQEMRKKLGAIDGVLVGDCYTSFLPYDIDTLLSDPIHPNDAGHQLYADTVFRSLGGVIAPVDDGRERLFGVALAEEPPGEDTGSGDEDAGTGAPDAGPQAGEDAAGTDAGTVGAPEDGGATEPDGASEGPSDAGAADASSSGDAVDSGCAAAPGRTAWPLGPVLVVLVAFALVEQRRRLRAPRR